MYKIPGAWKHYAVGVIDVEKFGKTDEMVDIMQTRYGKLQQQRGEWNNRTKL